jgi:hypothetical protein
MPVALLAVGGEVVFRIAPGTQWASENVWWMDEPTQSLKSDLQGAEQDVTFMI